MLTMQRQSLALMACLLLPGWAAAQESTTRGLNLGLHLAAASLSVEGGDQNAGGGGGIRIGYGVNRIVNLFFELDGATIDVTNAGGSVTGRWALAHGDLGVRFHFANSLRSFVPYLEAALSGRAVSITDAAFNQQDAGSVSFSGGALSLGGGISVYLQRTLALDIGLKLSGGKFTQVDVGNLSLSGLDIDATSSRLNIGLVWWP
jgi:hypothetical protein